MLIITDGAPRGHGYLEIDQRDVPAALPAGVQPHFEADTYTCSHCQHVVIMNPARVRERYKCKSCSRHICDGCAAKMVVGERCLTWSQKIEQMQERDARQIPSSNLILP